MNRLEILQMLYTGDHLDTVEKRFAARYVTASELENYLSVSRPAVLKKLEAFPFITVGTTRLWERTEELEDFIWVWAQRRIRNGDMEATPRQLIRMAHETNERMGEDNND